jgi:hypothetical protein
VGLRISRGARGLLACLSIALIAVALSTTPGAARAAAPLSWSSQAVAPAGGSPIVSISCVSASACAAVDAAGSVIVGDPSADAWSVVAGPKGPFDSVSCASASLCVAVGSGEPDLAVGGVGGGGWTTANTIDKEPITGVSCPSAGFCGAVDRAGDMLTSTTPSGSWGSPVNIAGATALNAISCSAESLCVAGAADGRLIAGPAAIADELASGSPVTGISCVPGLCAAAAESGAAMASADAGLSPATWSSTLLSPGPLTGVSCISTGLCVAIGHAGGAWASDDPTGALPGWNASTVGGAPTAISCVPEGLCAVGEADGSVAVGRLPAPVVSTGGPSEVTRTGAKVSGSVDPEDMPLASCGFEYGTGAGYGATVPCAVTPGPGSAAVTVSATLSGLAPASTYHYRLVASSATGSAVGAEGTFTTTAGPGVPLVHPEPYITGVPADGDRLACNPGIHGPSTATLAYAWWRDAAPIPGATKRIYHIGSADVGQHLQCEVIATDEAGSASARSDFVAVPAEGVPAAVGETTIGAARIVGGALQLPVSCSPAADPGCKLELRLTAVEMLRGNKLLAVNAQAPAKRTRAVRSRPVTLLLRKASVPRGRQRVISMRLNPTGRRLVSRYKRLSAQLTVEGTVIGVLSATLAKEKVGVVSAGARSGRRARAGRARGGRAHGAGRRR